MPKPLKFKAFEKAGELAKAELTLFRKVVEGIGDEYELDTDAIRIVILKTELAEAKEIIRKLQAKIKSMRDRLSEVTKKEAAEMNLEIMFPKKPKLKTKPNKRR